MRVARGASIIVAAVSLAGSLAGCAVTPEPIGPEVLDWEARVNIVEAGRDQEPFTRPVTIYEAMARALKYNLDLKVEMAQTALKNAELDLSNYNLLPTAVANAGYANRDNYNASSSLNLETGDQNFGASTSEERQSKTADLTFSWNILDFGLSYIRAQQAADRALINAELQKRVSHKLLEDVRTTFWRAVSYERLASRLRNVEGRVRAAISVSRDLSAIGETSPVAALTNERELVEIKRTIKELDRELIVAKAQLANLMAVPAGVNFTLDTSSRPHTPSHLSLTLPEMMDVAVRDRAELRENLYLQRINMKEADAALLQLLPGIQLYAGPNVDSNMFLLNNDWVSWGAKASWNLLRVFQYPAQSEVINQQQDVLKARALALTMAVMMQVRVSDISFKHAREELSVANEHVSVQQRLLRQMSHEVEAGRISDHVYLREEMNALIAEAKLDLAYSTLQSSFAGLLTSIGAEPYGAIDPWQSLGDMVTTLKHDPIQKGIIPAAPLPPVEVETVTVPDKVALQAQ